ncbi:hypothetical protein COCSADRAFT_155935 [Bipolaris sorokiniana ND90Pr]|uniref:Ubiquitin-like protease family profile domain-containing protein n=1 Tax=Cochliobolus sativus (strain ND90Pr / ATCC 201652) TaxID=665912 RepID=M2TKW4_COCSN|nr:uncharacterized protein COCSADRAFT_155935 [Bipolaris sorokiniana ND90Pr]EMD69786.1 hypothetical protein COCSADRAFT_155935 [Bipolaris sorokiniana ND90Pr]
MSNKRSYGAFLSSTPTDAPHSAHGFNPSQPHQAQQAVTPSTSSFCMPGAWPEELSIAEEVAPEPAPISVLTIIGKLVASVNVANLLNLPRRIANRFLHQQKIKAISVISSSGSNKRRFVAAGYRDDEAKTPSPSVRVRVHQARRQNERQKYPSLAQPEFRNYTASTEENREPAAPIQSTLQTRDAHISSGFEAHPFSHKPEPEPELNDEEDGDISIDFSFDDILTSTPPRNAQTGSPVHVAWNSPQTRLPASRIFPVRPTQPVLSSSSSRGPPQLQSSTRQVSQKPAPSLFKRHVETVQNPQRTGPRATKLPSITPLRRQLVKIQFGAEHRRLQATRQTEPSTIRSADQGFAESEPTKITPTPAVDQDLSYLPDASSSPQQVEAQSKINASPNQPNTQPASPEFEYTNDLSFLVDAPPRPSVRWAKHARTKSFYCDEKVSDMLDSTLEIINSSPVRGVWHNFQCNQQATSDTAPSSPQSLATDSPKAAAIDPHANDGGFHGVPLDTFDTSDDSLEESALSLELVQDLHNDFKTKLALAPPPPPPSKPLITPLSPEEMKTLYTAAANTSNGLKADKWVIDQKLYARDFATLLPQLFNGDPRAWLNDNIVNEYLSILVAAKKKEAGFEHKRGGPAPPVHAFSSFWYSTADTSRWSNRFQLKGKQYLDAQLILYPICDRGHWRLLAVYPQKRSIEYLDSMSLSGQKYIDKLDEYLQKELGDLYIAEEWSKGTAQRSSQQLNGSDCGVFTLLNALTLLRGDDTKLVLATNGMDDARKRIAATLLAGRPTTELD